MIFKLIILICCFISLTSSKCASSKCMSGSSRSSGSSKCSSSSGWQSCSRSTGSSSCGCGNLANTSSCNLGPYNYDDYSYEIIPMPDGVEVGILDSPSYDCRTRSLYFCDLFGYLIFRYSEDENKVHYTSIPGYAPISFFIPTRNDPYKFVFGNNRSYYLAQWDGMTGSTPTVLTKLFEVEQCTNHMTNWAMAGPRGALYTGTLAPELCGASTDQGFYRWTKSGQLQTLPGKYKVTNSIGYNCRKNILYHLDGCQQQLLSFDVNPKTGKLSKRRVILSNFGVPNTVAPVGSAINQWGHIFISAFGQNTLFIVDPDNKEIIDQIELPVQYPSSTAFGGGCSLDRLYVLSAKYAVNILTGTETGVVVPPPGGSLIVFRGFGKGMGTYKPCISC